MESVTAMFAILGVFFVPIAAAILIVWFYLRNVRRRNELKAEIYGKAIEKGVELPADLFGITPKLKKRNPLSSGIICIALGLGIALTFVVIGCVKGTASAFTVAALGFIPLMLGLGFLAIHFIGKKQRGEQK
ncbi:MAG: DUF6249 domain-containing protein [Prevotellaceae bacterium]|jgi:amino acid transporter|nr:DUF6249 domain-containing protein [Prevotellaceae bacterium]